jgi:hypothetical protein
MKFITIGTRGSAIPNLERLPKRLVVGKKYRPGPWQRGRDGHDEELISACAWVSESECLPKGRTGEIEIYELQDALKRGRVIQFQNVRWIHKMTNREFEGTALVPAEFLMGLGHRRLKFIAVLSHTWPHGRVERALVESRKSRREIEDKKYRNEEQVIRFQPLLKALLKKYVALPNGK